MSKIRLAICIRGNIRSWDKCKNNIFKIFNDTESFEIDWLFDTWDVNIWPKLTFTSDEVLLHRDQLRSPITDSIMSSIKNDFSSNNLNLVSCTKHPSIGSVIEPFNSYLNLIYLSNLSKRKQELKIKKTYDVVLQIRPDCIYSEHVGTLIKDGLKLLAFTTSILNLRGGDEKSDSDEIKSDIFFRTASATHGLLAGGPTKTMPLAYDLVFYGSNVEINMLSDCFLAVKNMRHYSNLIMGHSSHAWYIRKYGTFLKHGHEVNIIRNIEVDKLYSYNELSEDFFTDCTDTHRKLLERLHRLFYGKYSI